MSDKNTQLLQALLAETQAMRSAMTGTGMGVMGPEPLPRTHNKDGHKLLDWVQIVFDVQIAGNGRGLVSQNISQEAHFYLLFLTGTADVAPANMQLRIIDESSQNYMQHQGNFINWENFIGTAPANGVSTANQPYTIFGLRRYAVGTTITIELINNNVGLQTIQVVMHGVKTYVQYAGT